MKRFAMALFLACALFGTALAGDIPSTGSPAPGNTQGPTITTTVILTILSLIR